MDPLLLERLKRALAQAHRAPEPGPVPASGASIGEDRAAAFGEALQAASGRLVRCRDVEEARAWIEREVGGQRVVRIEDGPSEDDLRQADVGLDDADFLIAETGTVVRSYGTRTDARISLVPPKTLFLATRDRLVRDLPEALRRIAARHRSGRAYTVFITGPSRTADIEKQLVIPAHGPREVVVLLLDEGT